MIGPRSTPRVTTLGLPLLAATLLVAGCATVEGTSTVSSAGTGNSTGVTAPAAAEDGAVGPLRSDELHTIEVTFDEADFDEMIEVYASTGEKEWIEATVEIDGATFERVGLRLKGNSSLRGVTTDDDPATIPWLIRLDEFVDGQDLDGLTDLVVRSNTTASALNEAVALELLDLAGLASQDAIGTAFGVNGGEAVFRLVIEHPDDEWVDENFPAGGALYKAESTGDYSYRGDDPDAYDEVFDQEAGKDVADLTPLIEFLEFVNDADDSTFVAELGNRLDVDAFATYLAVQTLIDNFDDIDGPGNNSYLHLDPSTGRFTVVAWDHNLAFGASPGAGPDGGPDGGPAGGPTDAPGGGPAGAPGGGPADAPGGGPAGAPGGGPAGAPPGVPPGDRPAPPADGAFGGDDRGPGGPAGSNILVERFLAEDEWSELVEARTAALRAALYGSGVADAVLADWSELVASSGLVDADTVAAEAAAVAAVIAS